MCAAVFYSPDAQDSAPVYHFPNQYKMAQRGDMFYFQNKAASSAEVRVRGGSLAGQPSSIYNFLRDFLSLCANSCRHSGDTLQFKQWRQVVEVLGHIRRKSCLFTDMLHLRTACKRRVGELAVFSTKRWQIKENNFQNALSLCVMAPSMQHFFFFYLFENYKAYWNVSDGGQLDQRHLRVSCYCTRIRMSES